MASTFFTVAGAGLKDGTDWANAYDETALETGIEAAAANTIVYLDQGTYDSIFTADKIITLAAGVMVIATNDTAHAVPETLGAVTFDASATASVDIYIEGNGFVYGVTFKPGGVTSSSFVSIAASDGNRMVLQACIFQTTSSSANVSNGVKMGAGGATTSTYVVTKGCTFIWSNAAHNIRINGFWRSHGDTFCATGTASSTLFGVGSSGAKAWICCGNMARVTGTLFTAAMESQYVELYACKLGVGVTVWAPSVPTGGDVYLFDCASDDTHYALAHYNYYGTTVVSAAVYITADGPAYDGTNRFSWLITTTANASSAHPYISPWIDEYQVAATITPYLECLRKGNATSYTDSEVWAEWEYQGTSGFTLGVCDSDRNAIFNPTGTAQAVSSLTASDYTGEDGSNNAFFKIGPSASLTVQELGCKRMRVHVAVPSVTDLYVTPQIRPLT